MDQKDAQKVPLLAEEELAIDANGGGSWFLQGLCS